MNAAPYRLGRPSADFLGPRPDHRVSDIAGWGHGASVVHGPGAVHGHFGASGRTLDGCRP
jgi:hypothetical protein